MINDDEKLKLKLKLNNYKNEKKDCCRKLENA